MNNIINSIMNTNEKEKYLREGMIPHINKKEHYINPNVIAGLGGGFIVTRNQQDLKGKQQYFPSDELMDDIFDKDNFINYKRYN